MDRKINADIIVSIVEELVGSIEPVGSEHIDTVRYENQKILCDVVYDLVKLIVKNVRYADAPQYSLIRAGSSAKEFLGMLNEDFMLNDYVDEEEE